MKNTRRALFLSVVSIFLCVVMLAGTTFAWFTDSVESTGNIIKTGSLKVDLVRTPYENGVAGTEETLAHQSADPLFTYTLWEPGYTQVEGLRLENKGNLHFKYELSIVPNGTVSALANVIDVYVVDGAVSGRPTTGKVGTLASVLNAGGVLISGDTSEIDFDDTTVEVVFNKTITLKMQESAGNDYQNMSLVSGGFSVKLLATQLTKEEDSFDKDYDEDAEYPVEITPVATVDELADAIKAGGNVLLTEDIEITSTLMAYKDAVIDLNGKTVTASSNGAMFQSQSNAAPSLIITSSVAGAEINAGSNAVLLGYGSTEISNVVINVDSASTTSKPFSVYGDLTLGEGTVVNVKELGTSLISNNGKVAIVIDGAKINIGEFKVNGGKLITLNAASTLEMKNTDMKIGSFLLSQFGGEGLVNKIDGVTIENCTFDVTDSEGDSCTFVADATLGRYDLVKK